jgi:DNA-binding transcriptional regulator YdaS (Cro superfamily)
MEILNSYLIGKDRNEFAIKIGTTINYLNNLCSNSKSRPGKKLALRIENATNGAITRMELLYPRDPIPQAPTPKPHKERK